MGMVMVGAVSVDSWDQSWEKQMVRGEGRQVPGISWLCGAFPEERTNKEVAHFSQVDRKVDARRSRIRND